LYDLILEDATVLSGQGRRVADVGIEGSTITYVGNRPGGAAKRRVSAAGRFVIPGLVDTHVHFRSPGHPAKEDWATGSRAAASGGVTTVCDMPNTNPPTLTRVEWEEKRRLAEQESRVNYGIWVGASAGGLDEVRALTEPEGPACGIKVFMGSSTGPLLVDDATLEQYFAATGALMGVHAEDETILRETQARFREQLAPPHHLVRPPEAAVAAVRRLIELTRAYPRPVHICHVSTAAEVEELDIARRELPITTEVSPHHLWLSAEDELGNLGKVNPPLRPDADRRALWTAVRRGHIDTLGSDHAPHTREEKARPYWEAPSGMPGVETMLPLMLASVKLGRCSLERLVQLGAEAPCRIFGFAKKGKIAEGYDADLVLFSEGELTRLGPQGLLTRVGWSPFTGQRVAPKPEQVYVGGRLVAQRGVIVDDDTRGTLVSPARA
jgi:dihydroorotase